MFHNIPLINKFRFDFTNINFIKAFTNSFFIALLFSLPIYLAHFELNLKLVNTFFTTFSIYFILTTNKRNYFLIGFFIGLLWFYWISFSFRYYELYYLIPFMIVFVSTVYGLIFLVFRYIDNIFLKAIYFLLLEYIHPFSFNWFNPKILLVNSYISIDDISYVFFVLSIPLFIYLKSTNYKYLAIFLLVYSFEYNKNNIQYPKLNIQLVNTNLNQDDKWEKNNINSQILLNFKMIEESIAQKKDVIIFPETGFATFINLDYYLLDRLKEYSKNITIITGGLKAKDNSAYNSSYIFSNGEYKIIDKVVLVPFGEKIPLPKFLTDIINNIFFDGAKDFETGKEFEYIKIKDYYFKNAICYEATSKEAFADNPSYMIAISNNAWFTPSIEPTIQYLLLKYYAKKHNTLIFHATNKQKTAIIRPE